MRTPLEEANIDLPSNLPSGFLAELQVYMDREMRNMLLKEAGDIRLGALASNDLGGGLVLHAVADNLERLARQIRPETGTIPRIADDIIERLDQAYEDAERGVRSRIRSHARRLFRRGKSK